MSACVVPWTTSVYLFIYTSYDIYKLRRRRRRRRRRRHAEGAALLRPPRTPSMDTARLDSGLGAFERSERRRREASFLVAFVSRSSADLSSAFDGSKSAFASSTRFALIAPLSRELLDASSSSPTPARVGASLIICFAIVFAALPAWTPALTACRFVVKNPGGVARTDSLLGGHTAVDTCGTTGHRFARAASSSSSPPSAGTPIEPYNDKPPKNPPSPLFPYIAGTRRAAAAAATILANVSDASPVDRENVVAAR